MWVALFKVTRKLNSSLRILRKREHPARMDGNGVIRDDALCQQILEKSQYSVLLQQKLTVKYFSQLSDAAVILIKS